MNTEEEKGTSAEKGTVNTEEEKGTNSEGNSEHRRGEGKGGGRGTKSKQANKSIKPQRVGGWGAERERRREKFWPKRMEHEELFGNNEQKLKQTAEKTEGGVGGGVGVGIAGG